MRGYNRAVQGERGQDPEHLRPFRRRLSLAGGLHGTWGLGVL